MSGTVAKIEPKAKRKIETVLLTPDDAMALLEMNTRNRPISQPHVERIARQIRSGKWRFNGDTIKIASSGDVIDGQHRLWAIVEAKQPVETVVVRGLDADAFTTVDTIRRHRNFGDTVGLGGAQRYRNDIGQALAWLIRWQRGCIAEYRDPSNRVENSDIEEAFKAHPQIAAAVDRCRKLKRLGTLSQIAVLYYIIASRDEALGERFVETLLDPSGVALTDPFYQFRISLQADWRRRLDPRVTLAFGIKAANAAHADASLKKLIWRQQGRGAEQFPTLDF